jgi:predicted oxidoreductase
VGAGPYYAIRIYPGDGSTSLGLYVDEGARVLDADNRPIPGLYAAGLDMNSIWRGRPPGNGANNGPAMTFGFIAAQSLIADG